MEAESVRRRTDDVVARVNLFTDVGALRGAVAVVMLIGGAGAPAFHVPTVVLVCALSGSRWMLRSAVDRRPAVEADGPDRAQGTTTSLPG